ncbi:MAG: cyclic nucleotide-binding domain-containing protein [Bacteroidetes bacterium]|nr:cyclic nucleotide-binding domain-containing protein [Bacteroidota bacterium]
MPALSLLETLRTASLSVHFDEAHLRMLAAASERLTVAAGEVLFRQGDPSDAVYIVIDGCLEVAVRQDEGDEVVVGTLGPGNVLGEMQILTGGRRTASVYACEETELVKIGRTVIERLLAKSPELVRPMAELIRDRLRHNRLVAMLPNLFGALDEAALQDIEQHLTWMRLQRGEALLRQGDQSNDVYLLISGRLLAVRKRETGQETVVGEVQPGEIVGEMAFFTGEPRAVSLYALRDVDLVRFTRSAFTSITETYPQVMRAITKLLIRRLRSSNQARPPRNAVTNFAVVAISPGVSLDVFAQRLAKELVPYGKTSVLSSARIDQLLETPGVAQATDSEPNRYRLLALLDAQEAHHTFTIYLADREETAWTKRCIRQADLMLLVAEAHSESTLTALEHHFMPDPLYHTKVRQVLVLLHPDGQQRPVGTARWLAPRQLERHLHLRWDTEADFGRLARILTGNAIGLVLGGGGARSAAHMGVIQALLEEDVPIDLIGGTSAQYKIYHFMPEVFGIADTGRLFDFLELFVQGPTIENVTGFRIPIFLILYPEVSVDHITIKYVLAVFGVRLEVRRLNFLADKLDILRRNVLFDEAQITITSV